MPPKVTVDDRIRLLAAIMRYSVVGGNWEEVGLALGTSPRAAEERWKTLRGSEILLNGITASSVDMKLSRNQAQGAQMGGRGGKTLKGKKDRDVESEEDSELDMGNLTISNDKGQKSTKQKGAAGKRKGKIEPKVESSAEEEEIDEEEDEQDNSDSEEA